MVCAPTNKAVSIVANRFVAEITAAEKSSMNIIVTGDKDKLRDSGMPDVLKPYFLFRWQKTMALSWEQIEKCLEDSLRSGRPLDQEMRLSLCTLASHLHDRLKSSLPGLPPEIMEALDMACAMLDKLKSDLTVYYEPIIKSLAKFIRAFRQLDSLHLINELMRTAHVVFCTLCSAGSTSVIFTSDFDDLIVDEAAAATEPDIYIPFLLRPKRLLLVGDPKQLPSVVLSERAKRIGLDVSLHERLMYRCNFDFIMLSCQYRMHPHIASFPSNAFYGKGIENGPNVCQHGYGMHTCRLDGSAYTFYQVHCLPSVSDAMVSNSLEATVIAELVEALSERCKGDSNWESVDRIRVITFYQGQVALIRRKLHAKGFKKIFVGTVDASQGCESDIVLVSFVRGLDSAGFLVDDRRINVALTRARHQLICVGNVNAMGLLQGAKTETLRLMSHDATVRGTVSSWNDNTTTQTPP